MKQVIITKIVLLLLLVLSLQGQKNSDDIYYHCKADYDPVDTAKVIQTYSMGLDWLCSIKNLDTVVNEFWIRNCLQYDNVKAKVKISRGEFAGKDSRVCILCDCDYGLSYDGELCLENEFRVKSCQKYDQNGRDCSECKFQLNEKKTTSYEIYTTLSQYPFHAKHYEIDYGLYTVNDKGKPEYRTTCVNNRDKSTIDSTKDRVKYCKIYKSASDTNCDVCQFKDQWPPYIFPTTDTTDAVFDYTIAPSEMAQTDFWRTNYFYKYRLIRLYRQSDPNNYGCGNLSLEYETDPTRINFLYQDASSKQHKTNFQCKEGFRKVLGFTDPADSQALGGFTRTRYTTLSNSGCVDDATGTDALVFGCYKYVGPTTTTGCDYREIDDYKVGTNAQTKKYARQQYDTDFTTPTFDALLRDTSGDKKIYNANQLYLNYGDIVTCLKCKKVLVLTVKTEQIFTKDNLYCKTKADSLANCSTASTDSACATCDTGKVLDKNYKCVAPITNCVTTAHDVDKCNLCQFGYSYYNVSGYADNQKVCYYAERMHAAQKLNVAADYNNYAYGYEIWGLGGCQSIKTQKASGTSSGSLDVKGSHCESSAKCNTAQGFRLKLSDSGANQICECNPVATPIAFAVNEYSYSFCRPVAVSTDDCEIYFYLDSNSVKRCEKCKIYPRSTYDGIICGKSAADTANCLYPMQRFAETAIDKWCRFCANNYSLTNQGQCSKNEESTIIKVIDTKPLLVGGLTGCRQVDYWMDRQTTDSSHTVNYYDNRVTYRWNIKCYEPDSANKDKYNCLYSHYWDTATSTCKSYHDDSGEKCLFYDNWELSRCLSCATGYVNVKHVLYQRTESTTSFKCIAATSASITSINQIDSCLLFGLDGSSNIVCRQCKSGTGQNFGIVSASAPKMSRGVDCKPPGTNEVLVSVKHNYTRWTRKVVQCNRDTKYVLKNDESACELSNAQAQVLNCRVFKSGTTGETGQCPDPIADIDVCYLDDDYGFIYQKTAIVGTNMSKCIQNTSSTIKGAVLHCLTYSEDTSSPYELDLTVAANAIACKKCQYGYKINGTAPNQICVRSIDYCEEYLHVKTTKWNEQDDAQDKCIKCAPGYAVKYDGTACYQSPHTACVVSTGTDNECQLCAGPFFLQNKQCYERIPNCLAMDITDGTKCKKCEAGYGEFPSKTSATKCILGMEGCTEFQKLDDGSYNEKQCKTCEKSCPDNVTKNMYNAYNWRFFNLSPVITKGSDKYAWCVEGCAEFDINATSCKRCAKYSDVNQDLLTDAKKAQDIQFYFNDSKLCKRRTYINKNCDTYDTDNDKCLKCNSKYYLQTDPLIQCASCETVGDVRMPTITSGTCTATNGLSLDASTKCVCTTITCNTGNYINLTALTCNTRSITCISGDDTSYHASLDKCTKCNYTDNYLNRDANQTYGTCVARAIPDVCASTCITKSNYRDACNEVQDTSALTKDGCSDSTGTFRNNSQGWDKDSKCCIANETDAITNVKPKHCSKYAPYSGTIKCAECEPGFFRIKILINGQSAYKLACVWRPNCKTISNQCIGDPDLGSTCPQITGTTVTQDDNGWKVIRSKSQCLECNSNSFASNYGLVYRYTGSVSYESAICPDDTASPNYEQKYTDQTTCCVLNQGYSQTTGTSTYVSIIGCKEYWPKGSYTTSGTATPYNEINYCKECHKGWLLREQSIPTTGISIQDQSKLNNYCFYMQTPCQIEGCKLLQNKFTIDWLKCRSCYQTNEKRQTTSTLGYDINSNTHVCDDYDSANGRDGGASKPSALDGQGGIGQDGGITDLPQPKPPDPPGPTPKPDDKKTTGFSSILSIGIQTICVLAFGIFAFLI